jgi:ferrous iron transport protein A
MPVITPLSELTVGTVGIIEALPHDLDALTRLRELGFVPGTRVKLVRRAPLGDPIEVAVRGSRLAMRRGEARQILMKSAE